jgi:hypothetical protein
MQVIGGAFDMCLFCGTAAFGVGRSKLAMGIPGWHLYQMI